MWQKIIVFCLLLAGLVSCEKPVENLPILGEREAIEKTVDGKTVVDTLYHTIADFAFYDQDSALLTHENVDGKVYVANFFFANCPDICPKMHVEMIRVFEAFKDNPKVMILSHSIDPEHDTVAALKAYAKNLGVDGGNWRFLTGEKKAIHQVAQESYFATALEDEKASGGFYHNSYFILIDQHRRIRGVYEGLEPERVNQLIADIPKLLTGSVAK
jgi:protein SCO1